MYNKYTKYKFDSLVKFSHDNSEFKIFKFNTIIR